MAGGGLVSEFKRSIVEGKNYAPNGLNQMLYIQDLNNNFLIVNHIIKQAFVVSIFFPITTSLKQLGEKRTEKLSSDKQ